jgi:hypothetical protein
MIDVAYVAPAGAHPDCQQMFRFISHAVRWALPDLVGLL